LALFSTSLNFEPHTCCKSQEVKGQAHSMTSHVKICKIVSNSAGDC